VLSLLLDDERRYASSHLTDVAAESQSPAKTCTALALLRACEEIDLAPRNTAQQELRPPETSTFTTSREGEAPAEPTRELERSD
jgi:hypothetical protein